VSPRKNTKAIECTLTVKCTSSGKKLSPPLSRVPSSPPLRVGSAGPDPATLADGACAGRRRAVLGCRISLFSSRFRCSRSACFEIAPVATWSRSPSSSGRARRDCVFFLLAVLLWWQEVWHGRGLETGISNKAALPVS
jgi:hypothetical protein